MTTRLGMRGLAGGVAVLLAVATGAAAQQPRGATPPLERAHVVVPAPFQAAIEHGTRTATGEPGPRYWQNSADYDIGARVTPADSTLTGTERVVYHNNSPDTLGGVVFRLYQNLMSGRSPHEDPFPTVTPGMIVDALSEGGRPVVVEDTGGMRRPEPGHARIAGTLMGVALAEPLPPGGSRTFDVKWHFKIPGDWAPRMGMQDATTAQVAQWYPQIAVFDDLNGWDLAQYTGTGEFYLDYGKFRLSVTLPAGYVVGATGTLQNAAQVLTAAEQEALRRAATSDSLVRVVTADQFGAGKATAGAPGSELTWLFTADSVRDVAFAFSDHYLWDATSAVVDSSTGRRTLVNVLYRPGAPLFDQGWRMSKSALESHSRRLAPYPYPQLTDSEGGSGGMEYPMIVFVQAYSDPYGSDEVTAHEIGHEWFPMMVGSNETRYGWQDEGLNTFDTFFATDDFLPDSLHGHALEVAQEGYLGFIEHNDEPFTMMSPANGFGTVANSGYTAEAYDKPGSALYALMKTLGEDAFWKAYHEYIHRWAWKHPTPYDFFNTMSSVSGQELAPFWESWFFTDERLDQDVADVRQDGNTVTVTVRNLGGIPAPIDVTARTADGKTVSWREPMTVWYDGRQSTTTRHAVTGKVVEVVLDASQDFPDVNRENNQWRAVTR